MLSVGVNDKIAQERGGWATNHIMRSVYQHTFTEDRVMADLAIDNYFNALIETSSAQV